MTVVSAKSAPGYPLNIAQRMGLGMRYHAIADVERLGGWGLGFRVLSDLFVLAAVAATVLSVDRAIANGVPLAVFVAISALELGALALLSLCARLNYCGIRVRGTEVAVINPRGTIIVPASSVKGFGKGRFGFEDTLLLTDGREITLWGLGWWSALNNSLLRAGREELALRIAAAKES